MLKFLKEGEEGLGKARGVFERGGKGIEEQRGASVGEEKLFVKPETAVVALKLLEEEEG